jgi:hypothetical protein
VQPIVDPIADMDVPAPKIKKRAGGIVAGLLLLGLIGGAIYMIVQNQKSVGEKEDEAKQERERRDKELEAQRIAEQQRLAAEQADAGSVIVNASPVAGGVWLNLGRTPVTTKFNLPSAPRGAKSLEIRVELDGHQPIDTQVTNVHWSGDKANRSAKITVPLKPLAKDPKTGKLEVIKLRPSPAEPPTPPPGEPSVGPVTIDSTPQGAQVWLYIGATPDVRFDSLIAGRDYELRVLATDYLPGFITIAADEWRDPTGDPNKPIDVAKKKKEISKSVELRPEPKGK